MQELSASRSFFSSWLTHALAVWLFWAKGVNCCAELRGIINAGPDGGFCPPIGACRGFAGDCGALKAQFASIPVLPKFPDGLRDYECKVRIFTPRKGLLAHACCCCEDSPLTGHITRRRFPIPARGRRGSRWMY